MLFAAFRNTDILHITTWHIDVLTNTSGKFNFSELIKKLKSYSILDFFFKEIQLYFIFYYKIMARIIIKS